MNTDEQPVMTVESTLKQYGDHAPGKSVRIMIEVPMGDLGMFRQRVTLRYCGDSEYKFVCPMCRSETDGLYFMPPKTLWCECWDEHGQRRPDSSQKPHSHN